MDKNNFPLSKIRLLFIDICLFIINNNFTSWVDEAIQSSYLCYFNFGIVCYI